MAPKIFGAQWCANCKTAKAALEAKGIEFDYIDIDEFPALAQASVIRSLPTMITESGERVLGSQKIIAYVTAQSN